MIPARHWTLYAKQRPDPRLRRQSTKLLHQHLTSALTLMAPSTAKSKDKAQPKSRTKAQSRKKVTQSGNNDAETSIARSISDAQSVPLWLHQAVLDVFAQSFDAPDANVLRDQIQTVKGHLYARDFVAAWETPESQDAYCLRWSPSRALAYLDLLCTVPETLQFLTQTALHGDSSDGTFRDGIKIEDHIQPHNTKITCIGGGAGAEAVAFAAALRYAATKSRLPSETDGTIDTGIDDTRHVHLNAVDIASWSNVLTKLTTGINDVLGQVQPSSITSAVSQASETADSTTDLPPTQTQSSPPFTPPQLEFHHMDILALPASSLADLISTTSPTPPLITILFTLNELYSVSMPRTTTFLLSLTTVAPLGTLLLVVDSPGSYSTVKLGGTEKRYPMQWMLDHTLLQQASKTSTASASEGGRKKEDVSRWEKIGSEESRWWRMDRERLKYRVSGVQLEDMRMQWHLYRRI